MSGEEIAIRIIAERAGVPLDRSVKGKLTQDELVKFEKAAGEVSALPLMLRAVPGMSVAQLAARARRMKRKHNIGLLIVDYLQLMNGRSSASRSDNRAQEISNITSGLKQLALELNIPVIALSQLSRATDAREDKRPQLSDLRESGSIEQDADIVLFVYREEYYLQRKQPGAHDREEFGEWAAEMAKAAGKAEIIIGKNRHGAVGSVMTHFDSAIMRFSNLARPTEW